MYWDVLGGGGVGNYISHVRGGGGGEFRGLGLSVCEWYKSCPVGTTNHILGVVY